MGGEGTAQARARTPSCATDSSGSRATLGRALGRYRWSAQDNVTIHGVPYVGRVLPHSDTLLMATGFAKWGLTGGTAAAMILSDRILGRDNAWAGLFDPAPDRAARGRAKLVEEGARTGLRFVGDRLTSAARTRSRSSLRARATSSAIEAKVAEPPP